MLPLYSGKVWIISDKGEKLSIPYGGTSYIMILIHYIFMSINISYFIGAAYDTEKAFSRMFVTNPELTGLRDSWAYVDVLDMFWHIADGVYPDGHLMSRKIPPTTLNLSLLSPIRASISAGM